MDSASTDVRGLVGLGLAAGDVIGTAREVVSERRMSARVDWPVDGAIVRISPARRLHGRRSNALTAPSAHGGRRPHGVRLEGAEIPGGES